MNARVGGPRTFGVRGLLLDYASGATLEAPRARVEQDGLLVVSDGRIVARGTYSDVRPLHPDVPIETYSDKLICPGFIDAHIHFPQMDMMASFGHQLLEWLKMYTFPAEAAYGDQTFAEHQAGRFVRELLRHGTTTALTLGSVHPESIDALATVALSRNLRLVLGKVMMDRNAPIELRDTAVTGYEQTKRLIERWHGNGRLLYAVTPRFAGTSTPEQLDAAGALLREHPSVYLHTHLAENQAEIAWMRELFPERANYTDIYAHHGLLGERAILAHGVHLSDEELRLIVETRAVIAFCPSSNLFLGSGLFPFSKVRQLGVRLALATDVGAGTSFCQLRTLGDAYRVTQLGHAPLSPHEGWYLATLGSARALSLDDHVGNFDVGKEADFLVLGWQGVPLLEERVRRANSIEEVLFALTILGDDRCISRTYVGGTLAYDRDTE